MPTTRQLAAIMFADMVGYTALMQQDEALAIQKHDRTKKILDESLKKFSGKLLQNYGDGTLCIFASAIDCVNSAIEIQTQLMQSPKVDLRIGIHTGDIQHDETGIFGDGVNIASRLESLSVPGGIFISEKVYDDVRNQKNILVRDVGFFELKNVMQPVHVYAIANEGLAVPSREEIKGKTKQPVNSLAVLPFTNLSSDADNEFFSDGITEELLNALTAVDGLQVTSRTSSFALKGKQLDVRDIAATLNVDKILEGSVRRSGNRVRITAQLINAADGFHIWSETYDRDLTDIFQVQDEISRIIANKLRAKFSSLQKEEPLVKKFTKNLDAYSFYLQGKFHHNKETTNEMFLAIDCFRKAIELDSDFALAHAALAGAYAMLGSVGEISGQEAYQQIVTASNRALELDDSLAQGHVARGIAYLFFEWNWNEAYRSFIRAIELNPGASEAHWLLGYYYLIMDDPEEAVSYFQRALQLDPLSMAIARSLSIGYFYKGKFDEVIRLSDMQLDVTPDNWYALAIKGFVAGLKGDWNLALKIFLQTRELAGEAGAPLAYLAYGYGKLNRKAEAMAALKLLEDFQLAHPELANQEDLALAWFGIGDMDQAFHHLFKAIDRHEAMISFIINSPAYADLRNDARFAEAKKKMNL